jgi:hypothetical protein
MEQILHSGESLLLTFLSVIQRTTARRRLTTYRYKLGAVKEPLRTRLGLFCWQLRFGAQRASVNRERIITGWATARLF